MTVDGPGGGRVYAALTLMGVLTVLAQIVFLRRGIANFSGNELGIALGLFAWLLWVSLGGLLSRRLFPGLARPDLALYAALFLLVFLFPLTAILMDAVRPLLGVPVGQVVGLAFMAGSYLVILSPFCLVDGADFTFGAAAAGEEKAPLAFAAESAGAAVGGVFFFFVGVPHLQGYRLAWFLGLAITAAMAWIAGKHRPIRAISLLAAAAFLSLFVLDVDLKSLDDLRWGQFSVLAKRESPLGSMVWTEGSKGGQVLFYDGSPILSYPDLRSSEEAVHPGLLTHTDPKTVLLVSSRATGILGQVLAHPVARVDLVIMDRAVLEMEREFVPETAGSLADDRVRTLPGDARRHLRRTDDLTYDVVILDLPDPGTLQTSRLYTRGFFQEAARSLKPGGVLSFSVGEPANYVAPAQGKYLACLDGALAPFFPHRTWYPLSRYVVIAARDPIPPLTADLVDRVAGERLLDLRFLRSEYLDADLSADRMEAVERGLAAAAGTAPNTDLRPEAVRHRLRLWAGRTGYAGLLSLPERAGWRYAFLLGLAVLVLAAFAVGAAGGPGPGGAALLVMGGFSGIGAETVLLYLYQVSYGYLYSRIALLLSFYMAGMAFGAVLCPRADRPSRPAWLWSGFFLANAILLASGSAGRLPEPIGLVLFLLLVIVAGLLTGITFAAGSARLQTSGWRRVGGAAYGLDLAGAAAGVIICGLALPLMAGLFAPILYSLLLAASLGGGMALRERGR